MDYVNEFPLVVTIIGGIVAFIAWHAAPSVKLLKIKIKKGDE